jgi:hypothetical protein
VKLDFGILLILMSTVFGGHQVNFAMTIVFLYTLQLSITNLKSKPLVYSISRPLLIADLTPDSIIDSTTNVAA